MLTLSTNLKMRDVKLNVAHAFKRLRLIHNRPVRVRTDVNGKFSRSWMWSNGDNDWKPGERPDYVSPNQHHSHFNMQPHLEPSATPTTEEHSSSSRSSVSKLGGDQLAPTALSESSSVGVGLCCQTDEVKIGVTNDNNNNTIIVKTDVGNVVSSSSSSRFIVSSNGSSSRKPAPSMVPGSSNRNFAHQPNGRFNNGYF